MNDTSAAALAGGAIAVLVAAAGALGAVLARSASQAARSGVLPRQITVVGTGEARATPDRTTVQLGVQSEAKTAREALTGNSAKMQALIDELKQAGVQEKDIQTSNFSVSPTYSSNGRTVTGYQVNNTVAVVIRDVTRAAELLDKVVSAGANTIYGMSFGIEDPRALEDTARNAAILDARARAESMARAAGALVGNVLTIGETIGMPPPMPMSMRAAAEMKASGMPSVEAGEQVVSAQVQITYELR